MRIGMVGAGEVGQALTKAGLRSGHEVRISDIDPEIARRVAEELGAEAAQTNWDAVGPAEVVILAIPFDGVDDFVGELGSDLDGKVLVDPTNRFAPEQLDGTSNAELIQEKAPGALVVKAFNTVFASKQVEPLAEGVQLDGFVAANDDAARRQVLELTRDLAFVPWTAGR